MEEKRLQCRVITPMFIYGAYKEKEPELRTTELKGAMRYVYRMICHAPLNILAKDEAELFGGAAERNRQEEGHASPVYLAMRGEVHDTNGTLLLHKPQHCKENPVMKYFDRGSFEVIVRLNACIKRKRVLGGQTIDLNWYADFVELTLLLYGMGRRSRKGRGRVSVTGREYDSESQALHWLCTAFNRFSSVSSWKRSESYKIIGNEILACNDCSRLKRPVLQKVKIGRKLEACDITRYLGAVDLAGHDAKKGKLSEAQKASTGSVGSRLASPLIISFLQTTGGYFPIYIFVKGIRKRELIDSDFEYREMFISEVEKIMRGGRNR